MQLLSMLRLEWIILILNCTVWFVNLTNFVEYEDPVIWGTKSCVWLLYMFKMYILTVYFSGDSMSMSRSTSVPNVPYARLSQKEKDLDEDLENPTQS